MVAALYDQKTAKGQPPHQVGNKDGRLKKIAKRTSYLKSQEIVVFNLRLLCLPLIFLKPSIQAVLRKTN